MVQFLSSSESLSHAVELFHGVRSGSHRPPRGGRLSVSLARNAKEHLRVRYIEDEDKAQLLSRIQDSVFASLTRSAIPSVT